jgi:hypothetical protein
MTSNNNSLIGRKVIKNDMTFDPDQFITLNEPCHGCTGTIINVGNCIWGHFGRDSIRTFVTIKFDAWNNFPSSVMTMPISKGKHPSEKHVPIGDICGADFVD